MILNILSFVYVRVSERVWSFIFGNSKNLTASQVIQQVSQQNTCRSPSRQQKLFVERDSQTQLPCLD